MRGPVYWHPWLYRAAMVGLYGWEGYLQRYRVVASLVPPGCSVVDLCAGDGMLRHHLPAGTRYLAVDMNGPFLRRMARRGVDTMVADLRSVIPAGDVVVMMAALYHFAPSHAEVVRRAVAAAGRRFILSEPVENVAASANATVARAAAWASDPGDGTSGQRLGAADLERVMEQVPGGRVVHRAREWVLCWDKPPSA